MDCNIKGVELQTHLTRVEFLQTVDADNMKPRTKKEYIRLYNRVIKEWTTPEEWYESKQKRVSFDTRVSDIYWIIWSLTKEIPLPEEFIRVMNINEARKILARRLIDYQKLEQVYNKLSLDYSVKRLNRIFPTILRLCVFVGVNKVEKINQELVEKALDLELFPCITDGYTVLNVLYYMGFRNKPAEASIHAGIKKNKTVISHKWSDAMNKQVEYFVNDMKNCKGLVQKTVISKIGSLNTFAEWYSIKTEVNVIESLNDMTIEYWAEYVNYISSTVGKGNKTKYNILTDFVQFFKWLQTKALHIVTSDFEISQDSYKKLNDHAKEDTLAFEKREYGEKILKYLINEFKPKNVYEKFLTKAVIICANTGMRISEVRLIPYKGCFYSKDEGMYKIIFNFTDKLKQMYRPVYITEAGFNAICDLEKIRENHGLLTPKYNKETKSEFIHLFEYRGRCPINHTSFYKFLDHIKLQIGLVDQEGLPVEGGAHAYRHFFGMTLFRESGYNISVVRYLLGHKSYDMSYQYLEEEMQEISLNVRNQQDEERYSGKGLETIVELLMNKNVGEFIGIKKILQYSKDLSELIKSETLTRVPLGYCLKPCGNANKCLRCNKFILTSKDKGVLLDYAKDLFGFICYKTSKLSDTSEAMDNLNIQKDIADLAILLDETEQLGIEIKDFYNSIEGEQMINESKYIV